MNKYLITLCCLLLLYGCQKKDTLPTACFSMPAEIFMYEPVVFTSCSKDAGTYQWDFGDSSYSDAKSPEHVFSNAGIYTVVLHTENEEGMDVQTRNVSVLRYQLKTAELKNLINTNIENCNYVYLHLNNKHAARAEYPCEEGKLKFFHKDLNGNLWNSISTVPEAFVETSRSLNGPSKKEKLTTETIFDLKNELIYPGVVFTGNGFEATVDLEFTTSTEPFTINDKKTAP